MKYIQWPYSIEKYVSAAVKYCSRKKVFLFHVQHEGKCW